MPQPPPTTVETLLRLAAVPPPGPEAGTIAAAIGVDPGATSLPEEIRLLTRHGYRYLAGVLAAVVGLALTGCGSYHTAVVPAAQMQPQAIAICVDQRGYRVPDDYCPIGDQDGLLNAGYGWDYDPYPVSSTAVVVPYVGYPVSSSWTRTRPVNITTINIHRGADVAPPAPPAGQRGTAASVPLTQGSPVTSTVTRGGLGVGATARPVTTTSATYSPPKPGPVKRVWAAVKAKVRR